MSIVLIDASADSLTVSWPGTKLAKRYILEYKTAGDAEWELLSDNLSQTQVRKRNLMPEYQYFFRACAVFDDGPGDWMTHEDGFFPLTEEEENYSMAAPQVSKESYETVTIKWEEVEDAYAYELQMRENVGGAEWITIAEEVDGFEVKKRNLTSKMGYMFRVRPLNNEYEEAFSPPSNVMVAVDVPRPATTNRSGGVPTGQSSEEENYSMPAPWCKNAGRHALLIRWTKFDGATGYELQMRENTRKGTWSTIAQSISGTEVKKKNLTGIHGYQFRVKPLGVSETRYSAPSFGAIASQ